MTHVDALVSQLQSVKFDGLSVTVDRAYDVSGQVEGYSYAVSTRALDSHDSAFEQIQREIESDIKQIIEHYPEYTSYHIRIYSINGSFIRYGKLVLK